MARRWIIPKSGFKLRYEYRDHDAERLFEVEEIETQESTDCISGQVLRGLEETARLPGVWKDMHAADAARAPRWFQSEGACAAYYAYGRHLEDLYCDRPQKATVQHGWQATVSAMANGGSHVLPSDCMTATPDPNRPRTLPQASLLQGLAAVPRGARSKEQFFTENAETIVAVAGRWRSAFDDGGRCSPWAMAAARATPSTSPSSSCTRSSRSARRSRRSR